MAPLLRSPQSALFLLYWYFIEIFISFMAWWWFMDRERALIGDTLVDWLVAFNAIGAVVYILIGSVLMFWSYHRMHCLKRSCRRNRLFGGVALVFLFRDLPCFLIEFWIVWKYGWMHILQGISVMLTTFSFSISLLMVWFIWAWKAAKCLELNYGEEQRLIAKPAGQSTMEELPAQGSRLYRASGA